jgi:hypothetical protein
MRNDLVAVADRRRRCRATAREAPGSHRRCGGARTARRSA